MMNGNTIFFEMIEWIFISSVTIHTHARESYQLDMSQMVRSGSCFSRLSF